MFFNVVYFFYFSEECAFEDEEIVSVTSIILLFSSKTLDLASISDSHFLTPVNFMPRSFPGSPQTVSLT